MWRLLTKSWLKTTSMLTLREITPENHLDVRALKVHSHQSHFVADVDKSLADAYVWNGALARAAYEDDIAIGFVLIFPFQKNGLEIVNIVRFLVDAKFQGQGLGKRFFQAVLDWVDTFSPNLVRISTVPENEAALALYKQMGFVETGLEDGEIVLAMDKSADPA